VARRRAVVGSGMMAIQPVVFNQYFQETLLPLGG
jgi:hypothetical protein